MDDIWVIIGSIVLMVLSSLSSVKKRKGNTSSVDIEETQDTVVEDVFLEGELFADDEEERPIFTEQYVENLEQEYNNEDRERFEQVHLFAEEETNRVEVEPELGDIDNEERLENDRNGESKVGFDLRAAVIYSTILENPYINSKNK